MLKIRQKNILIGCFVWLMVMSGGYSYGQSSWISFEVLEGVDQSPLEQAVVTLDNQSGGFTDENGQLTLPTTPGSHKGYIRYLRMEEHQFEVDVAPGDTLFYRVEMEDIAPGLDVVVISASQGEKRLVEETVSVEVIDKKLVSNTNSLELGEAVNNSVGVQAQDGQITIRGGSAWAYGIGSRTAILVDGLPFVSADLGDGQLKMAPLEIMDQIEVVKGAASVVYGSNALNGVVNMRTLWPSQSQPHTEITQYTGIYGKPPRPEMRWWPLQEAPGFTGLFFNHTQKIKNTDVVIGGNYNYVNSFLELGDERRFRANFKTRIHSQKVKGLQFGLNGNVMLERSGRFYLAAHMIDSPYRRGDGSYDRYNRVNFDPHLTYFTEKGTMHRLKLRYLNVTRLGNGPDPNAISDYFMADYQYQRQITSSIKITAGLPVTYGTAVSNIFDQRRGAWSAAAYAQGEYEGERLTVIGGVRYEASAVDVIFSTGIPVFRAGVNYRAGKATYLRGSIGQAYRLPTIGERFVTAELSILNIIPNPDLLPEKGLGAEIGVRQGLSIGSWRGYADAAIFLNEYRNFVEYLMGFYGPNGEPSSDINDLGLRPTNVDDTRILGFEASIYGKGKIGEVQLRTLLGYTYHYPGQLDRDTTQRDFGVFVKNAVEGIFTRYDDEWSNQGQLIEENSARLMNFRMRHLFKGDIETTWRGFSMGYNFNLSSFPERFEFLFLVAVPGTAEYVNTHKNYDLIHNIRFGYQFSQTFRASFIIKNVTNHEYFVRPGRLEPPRNFTLQLNISLDGKKDKV